MKIDHWQHVSLLIRAQIDISEGKFDEEDPLDAAFNESSNPNQFRNIVLGAKQKPLSFSNIQSLRSEDPAFQKFQERFCHFLSVVFPEKTLAEYKLIFAQDKTVSFLKIIFHYSIAK
jgi:hypothetical protein